MPPTETSPSTWTYVSGLIPVLAILAMLSWTMWRSLKKSPAPARLIFKWVLTGVGLAGLVAIGVFIRNAIEQQAWDPGSAIFGVLTLAVLGLFFAIIWTPALTDLAARVLGNLYDGGNLEVLPEAHYSSAIAKRKRAEYQAALADIRKQLEKFPTDFAGQMLQAEIEAENLNDLPAASIAIQRLINQPGHAPRNIAYALNSLADWQLKFHADPEAARLSLEAITQRLPDTEFAVLAEQRISHLPSRAYLLESHDRPQMKVVKGVENIGLLSSSRHLAVPPEDPVAKTNELVQQLETHPHDHAAREQLAILYARHYQRLDLATEQLEQLLQQPHQPARTVVRWLNLLADLQLHGNAPSETIQATLRQIIERFPNHAAADLARNRLDLMALEIKAKAASRTVKLGNYEQNLGLKYGPPGSPR